MSETARVFVSATSDDLGSYRRIVSDTQLKLDAQPVTQDHFAPDSREVEQMLRNRIAACDAVICLVGAVYGHEPKQHDDGARRSYTQLEYDVAVELQKPLFVFLATDDCGLDQRAEEPDELRQLQFEHRRRIFQGEQVWSPFASREDLAAKVALLRFDADSLKQELTSRLVVAMFTDLVDSTQCKIELGDVQYVQSIAQPYNEIFHQVLSRFDEAELVDSAGDGFFATFARVSDAVNAALLFQELLRTHA